MDERWLLLTVLAVVAICLGVGARHALRRTARADRWLPEELGEARLAYVERTFRSTGPHSIVARVDRAYRSPQGVITLVELKTRRNERVHLSDIIELSAQRVALSGETGESVAPVAFVVVETGAGRRSRRVELMSTAEVENVAQRRKDLLDGRLAPRAPLHARQCLTCSFRNRCGLGPW